MTYQLPFHTLVKTEDDASACHISTKVPVLKGSQLITTCTADLICLVSELRIRLVACIRIINRVRDHFVTCTQGTSYDICM